MVQAQKQTYRSMESNRKTRNEPTLIWAINLQQGRQVYTMGKKMASSMNCVGKTGQLHTKESNWTTFSHYAQKYIHNGLKT